MVPLRPCPFCGGKVREEIDFGGILYAQCTNRNCMAVVSFSTKACLEHPELMPYYWNRRVENDKCGKGEKSNAL